MRFDLDALQQPVQAAAPDGAPMLLPLDDIDEDPLQPRCEFDAQALQQLADSIALRGVLQAISVRRHPDKPERWILNFGARRLRASKLAGQTQIPACVNEAATSYDQVIENEQREGLKPLELSLFVQRRIALGESQAEIARQLGKSAPYVTYATALIDAPDWLMTLYRDGRCRGLRELHELRQLERQHPECVLERVAKGGSITREVVTALKAGCGVTAHATAPVPGVSETPGAAPRPARARVTASMPAPAVASASSATTDRPGPACVHDGPVLLADMEGTTVEVVVDAAPLEDGSIYIRTSSTAVRQSVDAARLRLLRIVPGHGGH